MDLKEQIQKQLDDSITCYAEKAFDENTFAPVINFNFNGHFSVEVTSDAKISGINFEEMLGKTIVRKIAEGINASQYKTPEL